jgi:Lipocalin-like domain
MDRRRILTGSAAIAAVGVSMMAGRVTGQEKGKEKGKGPPAPPPPEPPKALKDAIVGTWRLLVIDGIKADGTKVPLFGPNPRGMAVFTADGHYIVSNMRDVVPKFAANDRLKGTPAEIKAAYEAENTHFGTYTTNEADKSVTLRIESSSFPNWTGTTQKRTITGSTNDDLVWSSPTPAAPSTETVRTDLVWRRMK